jgi:hypothetical protein
LYSSSSRPPEACKICSIWRSSSTLIDPHVYSATDSTSPFSFSENLWLLPNPALSKSSWSFEDAETPLGLTWYPPPFEDTLPGELKSSCFETLREWLAPVGLMLFALLELKAKESLGLSLVLLSDPMGLSYLSALNVPLEFADLGLLGDFSVLKDLVTSGGLCSTCLPI